MNTASRNSADRPRLREYSIARVAHALEQDQEQDGRRDAMSNSHPAVAEHHRQPVDLGAPVEPVGGLAGDMVARPPRTSSAPSAARAAGSRARHAPRRRTSGRSRLRVSCWRIISAEKASTPSTPQPKVWHSHRQAGDRHEQDRAQPELAEPRQPQPQREQVQRERHRQREIDEAELERDSCRRAAARTARSPGCGHAPRARSTAGPLTVSAGIVMHDQLDREFEPEAAWRAAR